MKRIIFLACIFFSLKTSAQRPDSVFAKVLRWETGFFRQNYFKIDLSFCNVGLGDSLVDNTVSFSGTKSARFKCRKEWADCQGSPRSDAAFPDSRSIKFPNNPNMRWFDFRIKLGPSYATYDPNPDLFFQIHHRTDTLYKVVPMNHQVVNGRYRFVVNCYPTGGSIVTTKMYDLGPVAQDTMKWVQWTYHFIPSTGIDGLWEIWKNGVKVLTVVGPNYNLNQDSWYAKIGIYKWRWKIGDPVSTVDERVLWIDDLRVGTDANTIDDFVTSLPNLNFTLKSTNVTCFGANNGSAAATIISGIKPRFSWSSGDTTASIINKAPGKYVLTVTDSLGATLKDSVVITQPAVLTASGSYTIVNQNSATVTIAGAGGTAPYNSTGIFNQVPGTTQNYPISDSKGCTASASVTIPAVPKGRKNNYLILNKL